MDKKFRYTNSAIILHTKQSKINIIFIAYKTEYILVWLKEL
jgi:hypothetical protein